MAWDAPDDERVTGYRIERDGQVIVADTSDIAMVYSITNDGTTFHYQDETVAPSTSYNYRVSALASHGRVSDAVSATVETAGLPPPTNPSATATEDSVTLTWDAPDHDSVTSYRIKRGGHVIVEDTGNTDTTYVDNSVLSGFTHRYTISALGPDGLYSTGAYVSVRVEGSITPWPRVPENLQATSASGSVTLTWDAPAEDNLITGYQILRRPIPKADHELTIIVENTGNADATYVDNDVEVDERYFYQIKAINERGISALSRPARALVQ